MSVPGRSAAGILSRRNILTAAIALIAGAALAQPKPTAPALSASPVLSASRSIMAGSMLSVTVARSPAGARLAIARPDDPATRAIVVVPLPPGATASLPTPGEPGLYELRLTHDQDGAPVILRRQPLATTPPGATLAAPARVARGKTLPVRGIGPNGERDRVMLVPAGARPDAEGPTFFPQENVEATLDAPDQPGAYELRYVMEAPVSGIRVLATRAVAVE